MAIQSSKETSETLEALKNNLINFTQPVLEFSNFFWFSEGKMTCENPPLGINISYKNTSIVPIKIRDITLLLYYDGKLLSPKENKSQLVGKIKESIVSAGNDIGMTQHNPQLFKESFSNKIDSYKPPFLEAHFASIISNLDGSNEFQVNFIHYIGIECNNFAFKSITAGKESITPTQNEQ